MSSITEESKQSLSSGHPRAGYLMVAHDAVMGTGTVPDHEQDIYDERVSAAQAHNDAVADHEDSVAKEEAEAAVEATVAAAAPVSASKSSTSTKSSGSSTSSGSS